MTFTNSKMVPVAFWIGFLALGFATSLGGPDRRHADRSMHGAKAVKMNQALAAAPRPDQARAETVAARD
jgi:hypothetical protein